MPTRALALLPLLLSACAAQPHAAAPRAPIISNPTFSSDIWCASQANAQVLFQDGAMPTPCNGGTLWAFGDTFLGVTSPPGSLTPPAKELHPTYRGGMLNATLAWLPAADTSLPPHLQYLTGEGGISISPLTNFPDEPADKMRMWPTGGVHLPPRTYLYYSMIQVTDAKPPWNFRGIGGGLAVSDTPLSTYRRITHSTHARDERVRERIPRMTSESLTAPDDWRFPIEPIQVLQAEHYLYLYEVRGEDPKGLLLARVKPNNIEDPHAYEFFTGLLSNTPQWSAQRSTAQIILKEAYGQVSIAWNPTLHAYLLATSSDFFHPNEIQFRTAPNPWGPFSPPTRLPIPEKPNKKTNLIYCTFIHPELSNPDGSIITLTFCRLLEGDWECSNPETVTVKITK